MDTEFHTPLLPMLTLSSNIPLSLPIIFPLSHLPIRTPVTYYHEPLNPFPLSPFESYFESPFLVSFPTEPILSQGSRTLQQNTQKSENYYIITSRT
jgi:hypothetical protein